jgi:hypothetical protein
VIEIDMRASQLRLFYALIDQPLPPGLADDPYAIGGLDRDPIKLVVTQALGKAQARSRRWSGSASADYRKDHPDRALSADYKFKVYQEAVLAAHPALERLGSPGVPQALDLQFIESEIIRLGMETLMHMGVPSLPVHDSLIVPEDAVDVASEVLEEAFTVVVEKELGRPTLHRPTLSVK